MRKPRRTPPLEADKDGVRRWKGLLIFPPNPQGYTHVSTPSGGLIPCRDLADAVQTINKLREYG